MAEGAQAVGRAFKVIRVVAQIQRSGASLSRIAQATGLNSSTTYRLLKSLVDERMLRFDEAARRYHIGALAFELGLAAAPEAQPQARWHDAVIEIARQTRLTTYLMARSDAEAVCLACAQGTTAMRAMPLEVGQRLPLGVGAGSLALLSALADDDINDILDSHDNRLGLFPGGIVKTSGILERVKLARRRGFAVSSETVALGIAGVGVALPRDLELTELAISVSAVTNTIGLAEAEALAAAISDLARSHRP